MVLQVNAFRNSQELFQHVSRAFVEYVTDVLSTEEQFRVVLGGGRTPIALNRCIVQLCRQSGCLWSGLHVYFSDERLVPSEHPDNTATMIQNTLTIPLNLPQDHVHPIRTDIPAQLAADAYDAELTALKRRHVAPLFHLALLGLGPDGHTASLFPNSGALQEHSRLVTVAGKGPEGWERVTLTFSALEDATRIWFVASGKEKQPVIDRLVNGPWDPSSCPAQGLRPQNGPVVLWVDQDALG